ncbi:SMI1/KNR4 family protein [Metabacillus sp. JX24]|uniref:SMI1/KNR4 family protein n=1 Tax=Metabacillus sp. JX24 TaxID=3240759 RepID=UPI00350F72A2
MSIKFPLDYREFIKDHNGCAPLNKNVVCINDFRETLNYLLSIGDQSRPIDLLSTYANIKDRLIDGVFPFAKDPGGNMFCFHFTNQNSEPEIVFWNHEEAFEDRNNALTFVCSSFTELISSLQAYEEE